MAERFDPYHRWLGIPPYLQPADFYRLLGLERYEPDTDVIEDAADRQMAHVRSKSAGIHVDVAQRLLNELAGARACLLDAARKRAYDEQLRGEQKDKHTSGTAGERPLQPPPSIPSAHGQRPAAPTKVTAAPPPQRRQPSASGEYVPRVRSRIAKPPPPQVAEETWPAVKPTGNSFSVKPNGRERVASQVLPPALALMILSPIGLLFSLLSMAGSMNDPEEARIVYDLAVAVCQVVIFWGALQMKTLESYAWAFVAAVLSVIPCLSSCCVLGIPFGIWALVVLCDPVVKGQFRS